MGVLQPWHAISIVFRSPRKSRQFWHLRSGGRTSRRFLLRLRRFPAGGAALTAPTSGGAATAGASPSAAAVGVTGALASAGGALSAAPVDASSSSASSFGSGRTPAASWAALVQLQVPVQLSVLHATWRSSRSPSSFSQFSQYC